MFSEYARNAVIGIVGGVVVFATFFVPILLVQVRMFGRVSALRLLGSAAGSIYGVALVAYTLFPLPADTTQVCTPPLQLIPFHFVSDVIRESVGQSVWGVLTSTAVIEYLFNIALFIPFGLIVRGFLGRGALFATVAGFATSLLIESTQYTGIWGIYSCAYRFADVDDLISNTGGALLGALLAPFILGWMPGVPQMRPGRLLPRAVTARRRWLGMFFDWAFYSLLSSVLVVPLVNVPRQLGATIPEWAEALVSSLLPGLVLFVIPPLRGSGVSLGQRAVWLTLEWGPGRRTVGRRLARMIVPLAWTALMTTGNLAPNTPLALVTVTAGVLAVVEIVAIGMTQARGLGNLLAGTRFADSRQHEMTASENAPTV